MEQFNHRSKIILVVTQDLLQGPLSALWVVPDGRKDDLSGQFTYTHVAVSSLAVTRCVGGLYGAGGILHLK